nr:putative gustatory receptor clone PTE01 [Castor canadensis]
MNAYLIFQHFFFHLKRCPDNTKLQNLTSVSEFHLNVLSEDPDLQQIFFVLFLLIYLLTVLGNLLIILAISYVSHLHTPMYFFLSNLSLADICFISTTVPHMIVNIQLHKKVISYVSCVTQMSFFGIFGCMDDLLLTVMAYDRYVAICHPLKYSIIMNPQRCAFLVLVCFLFSLLDTQLHNLIILNFPYFKDVEISNFFCNPPQLLSLVCSDIFTSNLLMYFTGTIFGFLPISGILCSYCEIISSILKIPSTSGKYKAFSTCGSHLLVVCLFYGTGLGVCLFSDVSSFPRESVIASVMYTVVTPMLNPFIYSLRNKDIKSAMRILYNRIMPKFSIVNISWIMQKN